METARGRLIAISGPSCGGKGPLLAAAAEFYPELDFFTFSVIKSRESRGKAPRPDEGEIWNDPDYFRPRAEIESLAGERYVYAVSHGFPQVLDLERVMTAPADLVVVEACQEIARELPTLNYLRDVEVMSLFVSPLGGEEIDRLQACNVNVAEYLKGLSVRRLVARAAFHGRPVDDALLADAAVRSGDAVEELRVAHMFDAVLVSRSGEGSADWNRGPSGHFHGRPTGEAAATLETFTQLLAGSPAPALETWTAPPLCC
jgi:guanylate kinase